jgi:hypothetical protein
MDRGGVDGDRGGEGREDRGALGSQRSVCPEAYNDTAHWRRNESRSEQTKATNGRMQHESAARCSPAGNRTCSMDVEWPVQTEREGRGTAECQRDRGERTQDQSASRKRHLAEMAAGWLLSSVQGRQFAVLLGVDSTSGTDDRLSGAWNAQTLSKDTCVSGSGDLRALCVPAPYQTTPGETISESVVRDWSIQPFRYPDS